MGSNREFRVDDLVRRISYSGLRWIIGSAVSGAICFGSYAVVYRDWHVGSIVGSVVALVLFGSSAGFEMLAFRKQCRIPLWSRNAITPVCLAALWSGLAGQLFLVSLFFLHGSAVTMMDVIAVFAVCAVPGAMIASLPAI
ncbi:MAG TPA: hypothetical protein VKM35_08605 [Arenimonas sp.]|uniref:hypothetical protein n=1 Tax=Arenimonas sp. TaxID=1872635 RepID=UPI002BEE86B0|nr:hypothetical protein [Arenimonas sp.]HMB57259.1 hypothetical protein [Arenimonas sp.]